MCADRLARWTQSALSTVPEAWRNRELMTIPAFSIAKLPPMPLRGKALNSRGWAAEPQSRGVAGMPIHAPSG